MKILTRINIILLMVILLPVFAPAMVSIDSNPGSKAEVSPLVIEPSITSKTAFAITPSLSLNDFIKVRVREVKCKYDAWLKESNAFIESEYKRGYEFGLIAEQHHDERLNIVKSKNNELIGLEANIKSTLEKVLKDIIKEYAKNGGRK